MYQVENRMMADARANIQQVGPVVPHPALSSCLGLEQRYAVRSMIHLGQR